MDVQYCEGSSPPTNVSSLIHVSKPNHSEAIHLSKDNQKERKIERKKVEETKNRKSGLPFS